MQIQSVGQKFYTYKSSETKKVAQNPAVHSTEQKEKLDTDKKKKILVGAGIAAVLLLLILFRKKIKNFFEGNGGRSGSGGSSGGGDGVGGHQGHGHGHGETPPPASNGGHNTPKPPEPRKSSGDQKQETTDYEALLKEFYEKGRQQKDPYTLKTEEEKRIWMEEDEELRKMYNKLRENNISFVIKEEFNPDPNIDRDKKKNYFYSWKVGHANANEASKLDFLEMYEKYGERYYDPPRQLNSAIAHLAIATDEPTSDKILNKYIHIIDRIAIKDPDGLNDAVWVAGAFERNAEIMSEDTLLNFIDVLKRISYQQQEFCTAKYAIGNTVHKDSPRVKAALEDFEKSVQDLPYLIK